MTNGFHRSAQYTLKRRLGSRSVSPSDLLVSALRVVAQASVYYVAKTGSDTNSGSASAPWLTIGHAALEAQAGATVYVGTGTYSESVLFANSGTSSAPIVFNGQGVAIVDGNGVACCTLRLSPRATVSSAAIRKGYSKSEHEWGQLPDDRRLHHAEL